MTMTSAACPVMPRMMTAVVFLSCLSNHRIQAQSRSFDDLARKYSIEIVTQGEPFPVRNFHGPISGTDATVAALEKYRPWFVSEFDLYPPALIRKVGLKRIVLCSDLAFDGQLRNAVPDFEHDTLYLEVVRGDYDPIYMRRVIHHDFFHIVDWKNDFMLMQDAAWCRLNADGFHYGIGGAAAQDDNQAGLLDPQLPGFLNRYSQTAVEEDKAEIFSILIVQRQHILDRAAQDRILDAKMQRMQRSLQDFCPEMNERFWERAQQISRESR